MNHAGEVQVTSTVTHFAQCHRCKMHAMQPTQNTYVCAYASQLHAAGRTMRARNVNHDRYARSTFARSPSASEPQFHTRAPQLQQNRIRAMHAHPRPPIRNGDTSAHVRRFARRCACTRTCPAPACFALSRHRVWPTIRLSHAARDVVRLAGGGRPRVPDRHRGRQLLSYLLVVDK